jgi:hypothetical protein
MFEFDENNLENYPLDIFIKLCYENKGKKVYESCLKEEIKNTISSLINDMSVEEITTLKFLIDLNKKVIENNGNNIDGLLKLKVDIMNEIVEQVYNIKTNNNEIKENKNG